MTYKTEKHGDFNRWEVFFSKLYNMKGRYKTFITAEVKLRRFNS